MSVKVPSHHPLQELLAKMLHGISCVPIDEQRRMVNRACKEAAKWHINEVDRMKWWVKEMVSYLVANNGLCPECDRFLGDFKDPCHPYVHREDCDLGKIVVK